MSYEQIIVDRKDRVGIITLNRPAVRNAMNRELSHALLEALHQVRERAEIRVAVITGAGRTFSAGADLSKLELFISIHVFAKDPGAVINNDFSPPFAIGRKICAVSPWLDSGNKCPDNIGCGRRCLRNSCERGGCGRPPSWGRCCSWCSGDDCWCHRRRNSGSGRRKCRRWCGRFNRS